MSTRLGLKIARSLKLFMDKLILPLLVLMIASCTVTKRVHRPGFHIEWKKNYRIQKDNVTAIEPSNTVQLSEVTEDEKPNSTLDKEVVPNVLRDEKSADDRQETSKEKSPVSKNLEEESTRRINLKQSRFYNPVEWNFKRDEVVESRSYDGLRTFGNVLFFIAGFFLLGVIFAYFGLWALESVFYSLVFSGNGFIVGVLGFLLFLVILLVVFVAYGVVEFILGGPLAGLIACGVCVAAGFLCYAIANGMEA